MKTIYLSGKVNEQMQNQVIDAIATEGEITFYLESEGGSCVNANVIIDQINKNKDRITLIANFYIASAGFRIFFYSKCKREILDNTEGLAHMGTQNIDIKGNMKIGPIQKWRLKDLMKDEYKQEKFLKTLGVSKKNRKLFLKGYDVSFNTKQLRKMLKTQENDL